MIRPSDSPDLTTLWLLDQCSWIQIESMTGTPEEELREIAEARGFERYQGSQRWNRGPCIDCEDVFDAEDLDEVHRCEECQQTAADRRRPPTWLEKERAASRRRMVERERGILPHLDRSYT